MSVCLWSEPSLLPPSPVPCTEESVSYSSKHPVYSRRVHGVHQPPPRHGSRHCCVGQILYKLY